MVDKRLRDIDIISICDNFNYGNRLQIYALQNFLKIDGLALCKCSWWENEFISRVKNKIYSLKNIIKFMINWKGFRKHSKIHFIADAIREYNISRFTFSKIDSEGSASLNMAVSYTHLTLPTK